MLRLKVSVEANAQQHDTDADERRAEGLPEMPQRRL
jgi:hypothetical protein